MQDTQKETGCDKLCDTISDMLFCMVLGIPWLMGIVLAKGFWETTISTVFPPYAWYLVVKHFMGL